MPNTKWTSALCTEDCTFQSTIDMVSFRLNRKWTIQIRSVQKKASICAGVGVCYCSTHGVDTVKRTINAKRYKQFYTICCHLENIKNIIMVGQYQTTVCVPNNSVRSR